MYTFGLFCMIYFVFLFSVLILVDKVWFFEMLFDFKREFMFIESFSVESWFKLLLFCLVMVLELMMVVCFFGIFLVIFFNCKMIKGENSSYV